MIVKLKYDEAFTARAVIYRKVMKPTARHVRNLRAFQLCKTKAVDLTPALGSSRLSCRKVHSSVRKNLLGGRIPYLEGINDVVAKRPADKYHVRVFGGGTR